MKRLKDMRKSGNIMYLTFYEDHKKTDVEKIFISSVEENAHL